MSCLGLRLQFVRGPSWCLHAVSVPLRGWVLSCNSSFLRQSGDLRIGLIGNSTLSVTVSVSVDGCLPLCVSSVTNWKLVQAVTFDPEGAVSGGSGRSCGSEWMH